MRQRPLVDQGERRRRGNRTGVRIPPPPLRHTLSPRLIDQQRFNRRRRTAGSAHPLRYADPLLYAAIPAWRVAHANPAATLREGGKSDTQCSKETGSCAAAHCGVAAASGSSGRLVAATTPTFPTRLGSDRQRRQRLVGWRPAFPRRCVGCALSRRESPSPIGSDAVVLWDAYPARLSGHRCALRRGGARPAASGRGGARARPTCRAPERAQATQAPSSGEPVRVP